MLSVRLAVFGRTVLQLDLWPDRPAEEPQEQGPGGGSAALELAEDVPGPRTKFGLTASSDS